MTKGTESAGADSSVKYIELKHTFEDRFEGREVEAAARFRKPSPAEISRAQRSMLKKPGLAMSNLLMDTVHPEDKEQLQQLLKDYTGLSTTFGSALFDSVGMGELGK
ncbi:MAG: hypothetical protein KKE73_09745 [Proteobacteria bacterium]|nr:hypothetical protein [Pseudomonadota bacterium]